MEQKFGWMVPGGGTHAVVRPRDGAHILGKQAAPPLAHHRRTSRPSRSSIYPPPPHPHGPPSDRRCS